MQQMPPAHGDSRTGAPAGARAAGEVRVGVQVDAEGFLPRQTLHDPRSASQVLSKAPEGGHVAHPGNCHPSAKLLGRKRDVQAIHG